MTDGADYASGSLATRAERGISVFVNTLVSRGLQEAGTLAAVGSDALLAVGDIFTAAMNGDGEAGQTSVGPTQLNPRLVTARVFGTEPNGAPLNADIVQGLARVAKGLVKLRVYDFAVLVKRIADAVGIDVVRQYGRVMELGWDKVRESNPKMQPSRPVAHFEAD